MFAQDCAINQVCYVGFFNFMKKSTQIQFDFEFLYNVHQFHTLVEYNKQKFSLHYKNIGTPEQTNKLLMGDKHQSHIDRPPYLCSA